MDCFTWFLLGAVLMTIVILILWPRPSRGPWD
jgi:hypothetical protein